MLGSIHIKDLAVVSSVALEFAPGLTALTGETGAGKSILIDALGLALGDRADNAMIRTGSDRAEITALFELHARSDIQDWLTENALDDGDLCLVRRVLVRDGNSRAFVNGTPVPIKTLQQLGEQLVDIHGQHAHQSLLKREHQRELLDAYAGETRLLKETADLYRQWQETSLEYQRLKDAAIERLERLDLLNFQVGELEGHNASSQELTELEDLHKRLSNAGSLREESQQILSLLFEDEDSAQYRINRAMVLMDELLALDPSLKGCREMLENAEIQVSEAVSEIRQYADNVETDPARLTAIEQRLGEYHSLARKFRCKPSELEQHLSLLQQERDTLVHADEHLQELEAHTSELRSQFLDTAGRLSKKRHEAARRLSQEVSERMKSLGMPDGALLFQLDTLPDEKANTNGVDRVEILVSTNPGMSPQPLTKVASGGELSRVSLAIQVATLNCGQVPTLIFDEVDVGIGGGVAEIVGRLLRQLGQERQVLCVTHLPQVASQGHQHLQVRKSSQAGVVRTEIDSLEENQRVEEIARMLGGLDITERTLDHAREMLSLTASEA
jgi:DNA repair protein RecN (Recombination protein N)